LKTSTTIAQTIVRISGAILIVLGLAFWTGHLDGLVPLHELLGFLLVFSLWTLALVGARSGVNRRFVVVAVLWGLLLPILGLSQAALVPGGFHWVIQVLHLLVGLGAIGQSENLARRIKQNLTHTLEPSR
jgi:hypothetical protein